MKKTIHVVANAHLDPVWLWDWKEGLNEGVRTSRTMVKLLDDYPELRFNRGEAMIYEYIQDNDPALFARIKELFLAGRWGIVGGNAIQPDMNMPETASMVRQFRYGTSYFHKEFGYDVRTAWAADSFGHSGCLPDILNHAGMTRFSSWRPLVALLKLPAETFWWESAGGGRLLTTRLDIGWYGANRDEMSSRLDKVLEVHANRSNRNIVIGCGLGDHGGGTTRRQIDDILRWRDAHPEIEVRFSTFDQYFDAVEAEIAEGTLEVPVYKGELNFSHRGCYSSMQDVKRQYRRNEAGVRLADRICAFADETGRVGGNSAVDEWRSVLFNGFHDILPGSSIEDALEQEVDQMRGAVYSASKRGFKALVDLSRRVNVSVPEAAYDAPEMAPVFVYNPQPRAYQGLVELETGLDYRPLPQYGGKDCVELLDENDAPIRFQQIGTANNFYGEALWRARVVAPLEIPAFGWKVVKFGVSDAPRRAEAVEAGAVKALAGTTLSNGTLTISTKLGDRSVVIRQEGRPDVCLSVATYEDRGGSWGSGDSPSAVKCQDLIEVWEVTVAKIVESGPERGSLFVEFTGRRSSVILHLKLGRGASRFDGEVRLLWNERGSRVKLRMTGGTSAIYDVPGGEMERGEVGLVPGIRYVKMQGDVSYGLATNGGYGYDLHQGMFAWTLERCSLYSTSGFNGPLDCPERPVERGEFKMHFAWDSDVSAAPALADALEFPPQWFLTWPHEGELPGCGTLNPMDLPEGVDLVDVDVRDGGVEIVLQNRTSESITVSPFGTAVQLPPWKLVDVRR